MTRRLGAKAPRPNTVIRPGSGVFDPPLTLDAASYAVRPLFPTPMAMARINEAPELNAELAAVILDRAGQDGGVARSNVGGWQSDADFADWAGKPGRRLLRVARRLADSITAVQTDGGLVGGAPEWKINAWANVSGPGAYSRRHHHPTAFWSGVYWVDAGDEESGGEFEVNDPRGVLPGFYAPQLRYAVSGCLSAGGQDFIEPATGQLILFPSWLEHSERTYRGQRPRISVAFNFSV